MARFGKNIVVRTLTGAVFVVVVVGAILWCRASQWTLAGVVAVGCCYEFWRLRPRWTTALWSIPYIIVPMMMFGALDPFLLLATITTVWVNDIFAYLIGVGIGRHRFWERLSPKKSWEGFVGGLLCATIYAWAVGHYWFCAQGFWWIGAWIVVILTAVAGDLFESWLKRRAGVKDSGKILPGHGGFLDRFDALLFALPVAYLYFWIISN